MASLDTLVDVIGGPLGLALLKVHQVWASPFNGGTLSPAALAIVRAAHIPIYTDGTPHELVTPTGAALAASLIRRFGHLPLVTVETFGCGAGSRELNERPNLLRLIIGRVSGVIGTTPEPVGTTPEPLGTTPEPIGTPPVPAAHLSTVLLLETQMDDMDPRVYPHLMEQLLQAGALDVWLTPITMKKGRPGLLLSVLALPHDETALAGILFRETTTLGIRRLPLERWILPRRAVPTSAARRLRYKEAHLGPGQWRRSVEYESARRLALRENAPLHQLLTTPTNRYGTPTKSE
ncbi:MAG: LarC family nickel insertion protein [Elusimicrobia bacterium]|nr:LarC family nickel insertion protein [Elusimicrobiota bacterium]